MDWEPVVGYGPALSKAVRQFMKSKRPRASQARSYLMLMATLDVRRGREKNFLLPMKDIVPAILHALDTTVPSESDLLTSRSQEAKLNLNFR